MALHRSARSLLMDEGGACREVLRDQGDISCHPSYSDKDIEGHREHTVYIGVHIPGNHRRSHRRRKHNRWISKGSTNTDDVKKETPSQRVAFIIGDDDKNDKTLCHPVFSEMAELSLHGDKWEWRETARWLRFEEDVEHGGMRWSKPYVATLPLHAVFETRCCLVNGTLMLDVEATTLEGLADVVVNTLIKQSQLSADQGPKLKELLLRRHHHLNEKRRDDLQRTPRLPIIRSLPDIARSQRGKIIQQSEGIGRNNTFDQLVGQDSPELPLKGNPHFRKKMPLDVEAANILIGEQEFLGHPVIAFIRLSNSVVLGDLTEVIIPTKFVFILLGPKHGHMKHFREIGRTMGTMLADDVFREVVYKAKTRQDLLAGIDEFMDASTVLPPTEWDPSIRIEPPPQIPSQEPRKKPNLIVKDVNTEEEEELHRKEMGLVRTGRIFGGLIDDVKRKLPWYASDFKDGFSIQSIATILFLYIATLSPIITFGGLLGEATNNRIAVIESLVSAFISGILYGFFSGQPLTILNTTGPVLVFETITFAFCKEYELDYLEFRCWIGIWTSIIMVILVAFECSAYVCFITRFTEENFAVLIALVYIYQAIEKMISLGRNNPIQLHGDLNSTAYSNISCMCLKGEINSTFTDDVVFTSRTECLEVFNGTSVPSTCVGPSYVPDVLLMSILEFLGTFLCVIFLKEFRFTHFFPFKIRQMVSDFSVIVAITIFTVLDHTVGLNIPKLYVPGSFTPTYEDRTWFIHPVNLNPWWSILAAIIPATLAVILIFMDQMITAVIINRKENKLKKGPGYHLDLLVLAILICINSLLGVPWLVAGTVVAITHVSALRMESEVAAPGEKPQFLGIRENRVTPIAIFVLIGASVGMVNVLTFIPMPVLFGVFMYMGVAPLKDIQFFQRLLLFLMPVKYQPDYPFLRHVRLLKVHLFTFIQLVCMSLLWVVKLTKPISIAFPFMLVVMVGVRKCLIWVFTDEELKQLDDIMPGRRKKKDEEQGLNNSEKQLTLLNKQYAFLGDGVNITDELAKTGIWKQVNNTLGVNGQPHFIKADHCRNRSNKKEDVLTEEEIEHLTNLNYLEEDKLLKTLSSDTKL